MTCLRKPLALLFAASLALALIPSISGGGGAAFAQANPCVGGVCR